MKLAVKMHGSSSHVIRSVESGKYTLKIVVDERPHHSGMSARELAIDISKGGEWGNPRPFMKQFFTTNKVEILSVVRAAAIKGTKGIKKDQYLLEAGWDIVSMFTAWVFSGGVVPENAMSTILNKKHNIVLIGEIKPGVEHLIEAVVPKVIKRKVK